jgi:hypothetical protein
MGLPVGAAAPSSGVTVTVSGGVPEPSLAACPSGGQHDQPGDEGHGSS